MNNAAPGWYPDPYQEDPARLALSRYWTGTEWSNATFDMTAAEAGQRFPDAAPHTSMPTSDPGIIAGNATAGFAANPAASSGGFAAPGAVPRPAATATQGGASVLPAPAQSPARRFISSFFRLDAGRIAVIAGSVVAVLGLFFPWIEAPIDKANGFEKDLPWVITGTAGGNSTAFFPHGYLIACLMIAALVAGLGLAHRARVLAGWTSALTLGLCILNWFQFSDAIEGSNLEVGTGVWLTGIAAAAATLGALASPLYGRLRLDDAAVVVRAID